MLELLLQLLLLALKLLQLLRGCLQCDALRLRKRKRDRRTTAIVARGFCVGSERDQRRPADGCCVRPLDHRCHDRPCCDTDDSPSNCVTGKAKHGSSARCVRG